VHLLVGQDVGRLEELRIEGEAALVVEIGLGDGRAVDLGLEHHTAHVGFVNQAATVVKARRLLDKASCPRAPYGPGPSASAW